MASDFELLAAIDLRGGRVVRLEQGSFDRETTFSDDPSTVASRFIAAGARWLHVVDLDGARAGEPVQIDAIASLVAAAAGRASVEVSGGLRSAAAVEAAIGRGADRIALGTVAVEQPDLVRDVVRRHGPDRVAVAVDVRAGRALGRAWKERAAGVDPAELIMTLAAAGVRTFEVTAIERDGLSDGPDLELLRHLAGTTDARIIASGGIRSEQDLRDVAGIGCRGAIVGRALYDGTLTVETAITAVAAGPGPEDAAPAQ